MKYIVSALTKYVLNQKPQESSKTIFRIDGFEDVRIYDLFCKQISQHCNTLGLNLIAKLSYYKYLEFKGKNNPEYQPSILSMEQNSWIDKDDSLTQYRNILSTDDDIKIIILMGTEVIEDKGGLHDTFCINSARLKADLRGQYSSIFDMNGWEIEEKTCIDRLFKWLFDLVPVNLYRLSCLADDWHDVDSITMFLEYFYKSLPIWGLCKREENLPSIRIINNSTKKNLLETNYDFIERNSFRKITKKQFENYNKKIVEYNDMDLPFSDQYDGWANQSIKSYDEYSPSLSEFILGKDVRKLRDLLIDVDFAITEAVLGLKLDKIKTKRATTQKVYGNPLSAMMGTLFDVLINLDDELSEFVASIDFNFTHLKLVNEMNNSESMNATEQLETTYKNICFIVGGVFTYIGKRNWYHGDDEIEVISSPSNFFTPSDTVEHLENDKITALGILQTVNKAEFSIILRDIEGNQIGKGKDYEWCFSNEESWLYSFTDICNKYRELEEQFSNSYIPLGTNKDLKRIMHLKSEQEFFDVYEEMDINYEDLLQVAKKDQSAQALPWKAEFVELGKSFINFCSSITIKGFYGSIEEINIFTETYIKLGKKILENSYTENLKWVLNLYIHTFVIEPNNYAVIRDEETDFCIIPPWHPAILQKLIHQAVFIMDGCEQWWNKNICNSENPSQKSALENIAELEQLSCIHQAIDIFPTVGRQYFGNLHTFGNFCLCGNYTASDNIRIKDVLRKEAVFDDDFTEGEFKQVDADAQMIFDVLEDYVKAFPNKSNELNLAFIDPSELQPVVAAVHKYIDKVKKVNTVIDAPIRLTLSILVKPENRGGRNYLSYWVNTFFSQDENTDIKIYLNEWTTKDDIKKHLTINTDIIFMMDLLKVDNFGFISHTDETPICPRDCKYPMVFKPSPSSQTSVKRRIELTQPQFEAATIHSQVVYYNNHLNEQESKEVVVVKEVCIDKDRHDLIDLLHEKGYWVICIDGGMDGALLKNNSISKEIYSIIGFSTGKGHHGQYNLTITAREAIVTQVKKRFENRVRNLFKWSEARAKSAADICVKEASKLDGVSLLSAINQNTYNINEFMAYILTSVQMQQEYAGEALDVVIHLDSYRHWFSKDAYNVDSENKLRPDFLNVTAKINEDGKLLLRATVIECKIAKYSNSTERINKALIQVEHGLNILTELFKPTPNDSVRRRYWYAQLYRALAFSQITFHDNTDEYVKLATGLKAILDGNFDIEWKGRIMGYWIDMQGENVVSQISEGKNAIEILSVPQRVIQKLILGDNEAVVNYVEVVPDLIEDIIDASNDENLDDDLNVDDNYTDNKVVPFIDPTSTNTVPPNPSVYPLPIEPPVYSYVADESATRSLSDIKVYIGKDTRDNPIVWNFGHPKLSNRHILITGRSGQGKTYYLQTMLKELTEQGISSVVFDYTEGFRTDQLEKEFIQSLGDKINQKIVYVTGVPINPFRKQEIEIAGTKIPEKTTDVALRLANIFSNVYKFGEQQFSAIYEACRSGIDKYGSNMHMQFLKGELSGINSGPARSVLSKLAPFLDSNIFDIGGTFDWNEVTNTKGTLTIFQLTNFVREIQVIITEMMLWDAWHYNKKYGNKDTPFVVVLDEAQNLSHKEGSPSAMILTEGRKFGWSAWFATQFLKAQLSDDEINRLQQAAFRVYFKPTDDELVSISKQLDPTPQGSANWLNQLRNLQKGQCIVAGEREKFNGDFGPANPVVTKIASFKERGEKDE